MKKTVAVLMIAMMTVATGCATMNREIDTKGKTSRQIQFEQEENNRAIVTKGAASFGGLVLGGIIGLLTSAKDKAITATLTGCIAGGLVGFGVGYVIFENSKPVEQKPGDNIIKEKFQDYRNIQGKD